MIENDCQITNDNSFIIKINIKAKFEYSTKGSSKFGFYICLLLYNVTRYVVRKHLGPSKGPSFHLNRTFKKNFHLKTWTFTKYRLKNGPFTKFFQL